MRQVINFRNIKELADIVSSADKGSYLVTATEDLGTSLRTSYSFHENTVIKGASSFVQMFIPEWESTIKDIKNYVRIRSVVEDYISGNCSINAETAAYLRRNTAEMWNAIVLLIEADIYPEDIPVAPKYLRYFKDIWEQIEIDNPQIVEFRTKTKFNLSDSKHVEALLKSDGLQSNNVIYLIGFYFITPIQERIIDIIETSGIKVYFLNCKNEEYSYMSEIWDITFPSDIYIQHNKYKNTALKNIYGDALKKPDTKIPCTITKHNNVFSFATMVKNAFDNGDLIYSPNSKDSEKYLREFYPEHFKDKHLLSYPVGQYIYHLHMMWDTFENKLIFDFDNVYQCFASGWLITESLNGKEYLRLLSLLKNYFKNCNDLEQWSRNIKSLKDAKNIANIFDNEETRTNRWHKLLGQPLNKIGVHTITIDDILDIETLFNKLVEDAFLLFSKVGKIDLYDHFSKIKRILENKITLDKDKILTEESEIINELIRKLSDKSVQSITCPLNGIKDAILLLINGQERNNSSFVEKFNMNNHMVYPIEMIESAMIKKNIKKVHIVLADEFSLPGKTTELPWPLDINIVDCMLNSITNKRRKYLEALKSIVVNAPISNRYLFFTFMGIENAELNIEWISKKNNRDIDVSPFVSLFNFMKTPDNNLIKREEYSLDNMPNFNIDPVKPIGVPDDVVMDYLLCKERYTYSYILNEYPFFSSDFHYSFLLTKMISAFSIVANLDKKEISTELCRLFPFFRNVELKQSVDFASLKLKAKISPILYDNVEYPGVRLMIHYLDDDLINYCERALEKSMDGGDNQEPVPEKRCIYCPYTNVCMSKYITEEGGTRE